MNLPMPHPAQLPAYYINLASRLDRREFMERQFATLGINAERVDAVTVDRLPPDLIARLRAPGVIWDTPPVYIASLLSHQAAWRRIVESGSPAGLVFEDDVILDESLRDFLDPDLAQRLGADLIKLETFGGSILLGAGVSRSASGAVLHELQSSHFGAAAYLITAEAAAAALAHPRLGQLHTDRFLFGRGGPHLLHRKVLQVVPAPCIQLMKIGRRDDSLARSDLAPPTGAEAGKPKARKPLRLPSPEHLRVAARHTSLLLRLVLRDPAAVTRKRRRVPFAAERLA